MFNTLYFKINTHHSLRVLQKDDTTALYNFFTYNRDYVSRWIPPLSQIIAQQDVKRFIQNAIDNYLQGQALNFGIWYNNKLAGVIGLQFINQANRNASIWYWIGKEYEGKGIVTTSCKFLVEYSFNELKLNRLEIQCATDNHKSTKVAKSLGFTYEGTMRECEWLNDHYVDHHCYGLLLKEWKANT